MLKKTFTPRSMPPTGSLLDRLLAARGADRPLTGCGLQSLIPIQKLTNVVAMADRLLELIAAKKHLLVVADYDSDGATACAIVMKGLTAYGANIDFMVPNRFIHGYGLTESIVIEAHETFNPDVIITVDNGIASFDGALKAKAFGIEVLVTDHHLPADGVPDVKLIVNPNQRGCDFPSKNLAGCGVAFYVMAAVFHRMRQRNIPMANPDFKLLDLIDLVGLGTIADVVKLDYNNRVLVKLALDRIRNKQCCEGIRALLEVSKRAPEEVNSSDFGFLLGPRLNAAGRLDDMSIGIRCLLTRDTREAFVLAEKLQELNIERKSIESDIKDVAYEQMGEPPDNQYSLIAYDPSWHQGVIGIVASRLKDRWYRPTFVFALADGGYYKGSGRSIQGFHLRDAMDLVYKRRPDIMSKFGGHAMAAGATLNPGKLDDFKVEFEKVCHEWLKPSDLAQNIETDGAIDIAQVTPDDLRTFNTEVWGAGFPEPLFQGVFTLVEQRILKEKHLQLRLQTDKGDTVDAIWFMQAKPLNQTKVTLAYSLVVEEFRGNTRVRMQIRDYLPEVAPATVVPKMAFDGFVIENGVYL